MGSVTATICMTPESVSFWTRWRTAASLRPTALPISAYERRPSSCSCSMMAFDTESSWRGLAGAPRRESITPRFCQRGTARASGSVAQGAFYDGIRGIGGRNRGSGARLPAMSGTLRNFVGGAYVESSSDERLDLIDPVTEQVYGQSPISDAEDVDRAFSSAAAAFAEWRDATPSERQLALFRIADAIERRADEFAELESKDTGKPLASLVDDEILVSVDQIRFFAGAARVLEGRA